MSGEDTHALLIQSAECQSYELEVAGSSPAQSIKENIFFYIMNTKLCKVCNTEKDTFMFNKHKTGQYGVRGICKICCKKTYDTPTDGFFNCPKCNVVKHVNEFGKDSRRSNGIKYYCKECSNEQTRQRRKNTPGLYAEESRQRRLNIKNKIRMNLGTRLWQVVSKKHGNTMELVGCTTDFLVSYLETKFTEGMTLENYGKWHIDHIIPCASFNLEEPEEQKRCFHWTNLQPLWAADNIRKGCRL